MVNLDDLIPIEEAVQTYKRSRNYLLDRVAEGSLSRASIPGDRKLYLLRSELDAFFTPLIEKKGDPKNE